MDWGALPRIWGGVDLGECREVFIKKYYIEYVKKIYMYDMRKLSKIYRFVYMKKGYFMKFCDK